MRRARRLTRVRRLFLILLGITVGVVCLGASLAKVPKKAELVEVSGPLSAFAIHESGRHRYEVLLAIDGAPHRYWTNVLSREQAEHQLDGRVRVSLFAEAKPSYQPIDGDAYKSWGLWIDGRRVYSVEAALAEDAVLLHFLIPLLGVGFLAMAFLLGRGLRTTRGRGAR